jgi:2-polyprenyl-6-methoxyphenol hydroxylase-like FAD-dependent oxidoreductase
VVGADGINSVVRSLIFPGNTPEYTGAAIWSFTLPKRYWKDNPLTVKTHWGEERFIGIFPIKGGAAVAFSMPLSPDIRPSTVDIVKAFSDLSPEVARLVAAAKDADVYSSHLRNIKLKHWYKGHVILAGDAAHAMMPSTGMGASIGLDDADALAALILQTPEGEFARVPKAYEKLRKSKSESTQRQAYSVGKMMLARGLKLAVRDRLIPYIPKTAFSRSIAK